MDHKPHRSPKDLSHRSPPLTGTLSAGPHPHLAPHTACLGGSGHGGSPCSLPPQFMFVYPAASGPLAALLLASVPAYCLHWPFSC